MSENEKWHAMTATMVGGVLERQVDGDSDLNAGSGQFTARQVYQQALTVFLTRAEAAQWAAVLTDYAEGLS